MTSLLVCIDGSSYADNICKHAAWAAKRLNADIQLLHVLRRHSDYEAMTTDLTGAVGLGARSSLLESLAQVDEERGRLDQQKGKLILDHGETLLRAAGVERIQRLHRRGNLADTVKELETNATMVFIGKRGEHTNLQSAFLGSNLEKVARSTQKPLFVVSSVLRPLNQFLIAYDGKGNSRKAVEMIAQSPLLKGLTCHLIAIVSAGETVDLQTPAHQLEQAGFSVATHLTEGQHPAEIIAAHVSAHEIDLLVMGAYSHSQLRTLLLGSTTSALIKACLVPLLLFR